MCRATETTNEQQLLNESKEMIMACLTKLYDNDASLFERNRGKGVCERSLVFRFAHYLQNEISATNKFNDLFVDCDFNSSHELTLGPRGNIRWREREGKPIPNLDGSSTRRFIDIIVHKRDDNRETNFICFEIKKWNNTSRKEKDKDIKNMIKMTTYYSYSFGFHLILGKCKEKTSWTIFRDGAPINIANQRVFLNERT